VKRLLFIADSRSHWEDVEGLLGGANTHTRTLSPLEAHRDLKKEKPDLLILGDADLDLFAEVGKDLAKLIISENLPPGTVIRAREGRNIVKIGWPADEEVLQELTRRLLLVPERKPCRKGLRITARKERRTFRGESKDFSLTGMAFRTAGTLTAGEEIIVAFGLNGRGGDLDLEAQVVRSLPDCAGARILYGARFNLLSPEDRHSLERFVWGIKGRAS
jgi:hypothetical protein